MFLIFSHNLPLTSRSLTLGLICTPVSPYAHMLCTQLLASVPEHQTPETNRSSGSGEKASGRKSIDIVLPNADLSPENAATSEVNALASLTEVRQSSGVDGTARSSTAAGATAAAPGLSVVTLEARQLGRKLMMANELVVLDAAATAAAAPKSPPPSPVNHSPTVLTRGVSAASADQRRHLSSTPATAATLEPVKLTTLSVKPRSATTANSSHRGGAGGSGSGGGAQTRLTSRSASHVYDSRHHGNEHRSDGARHDANQPRTVHFADSVHMAAGDLSREPTVIIEDFSDVSLTAADLEHDLSLSAGHAANQLVTQRRYSLT